MSNIDSFTNSVSCAILITIKIVVIFNKISSTWLNLLGFLFRLAYQQTLLSFVTMQTLKYIYRFLQVLIGWLFPYQISRHWKAKWSLGYRFGPWRVSRYFRNIFWPSQFQNSTIQTSWWGMGFPKQRNWGMEWNDCKSYEWRSWHDHCYFNDMLQENTSC